MNIEKILEQAKLAKEHWTGGFTPLDNLSKALIAAAKLLQKVEIVQEGEKPVKGDFVIATNTDTWENNVFMCDWSQEQYLKENPNIIMEIIQRNGKPTITLPEEKQ